MLLDFIFTFDLGYLAFPRRSRNLWCNCRHFFGWVLLLSFFLSFFVISLEWVLFHIFLFMVAGVSTCRSVVLSFRLSFTSVTLVFLFFHQWSSLRKLPPHTWFSICLINCCIWSTWIYSYLVKYALKLTLSLKYAHFPHFPWAYLHFPWPIFTLLGWALCNPKARATSLASGIAQCVVHAGS